MSRIFADTNFLCGLENSNDTLHQRAKKAKGEVGFISTTSSWFNCAGDRIHY